MTMGYAFGAITEREPAVRRRLCLRIGLTATGLFVICAAVMAVVMRSRGGGNSAPILFQVLNPPKYPVSQLFLLMTLGPALALLPSLERARGRIAGILETFGRVPMFFYLLHIPLIHAAALVVNTVRGAGYHPEWYATAPYANVPDGQHWSLPLLYFVWAIVVAMLYFACRWFDGVKARRRNTWLRYI
jgi:uncharacterized membrane protein